MQAYALGSDANPSEDVPFSVTDVMADGGTGTVTATGSTGSSTGSDLEATATTTGTGPLIGAIRSSQYTVEEVLLMVNVGSLLLLSAWLYMEVSAA